VIESKQRRKRTLPSHTKSQAALGSDRQRDRIPLVATAFLLLAALLFRSCLWAQGGGIPAPSFSPDSIVSSANGSSDSLTPYGIASIYGSNLAFSTETVSLESVGHGLLPRTLAGVTILVGGVAASLLYVSPAQVNFLMPSLLPGATTVVLVRESNATQPSSINLLDAAPALFVIDAIPAAEHADGSLISTSSPAIPGEVLVVYCTGLGQTKPAQISGMIPTGAAPILLRGQLRVLLDGHAVPDANILYAGITPGFPGLYQINVRLPGDLTGSPALQIALENQVSQSSLQLPLAGGGP
jgi:uncharacterized protein (TIGR03437 family)